MVAKGVTPAPNKQNVRRNNPRVSGEASNCSKREETTKTDINGIAKKC